MLCKQQGQRGGVVGCYQERHPHARPQDREEAGRATWKRQWLEGPGEGNDEEEHSEGDRGEGKCLQAGWCKFLSQMLESNHLEVRNQAGAKGPGLSGAVGVEGVYSQLSPATGLQLGVCHITRGRNHPCPLEAGEHHGGHSECRVLSFGQEEVGLPTLQIRKKQRDLGKGEVSSDSVQIVG